MGHQVVAVLAVHNEEDVLPYTLKHLEKQVDAVVAVLDKCSDRSEQLLKYAKNAVRFAPNFKYIGHLWRNYRAETKAHGIKIARQLFRDCYILMVDADVIVDAVSVAKAKALLDSSDKDAVVFTYKQYSLEGSMLNRVKDECLNLLGKITKRFTRQPVKTGIYLVRAGKACMDDVASDYETILPKLNVAWLPTDFTHLRPRYDKRSQLVMGVSRATLKDYNLRKVLLYSLFTLSPYVTAGFLTAKLRGYVTVEDGSY